MGISWWEDCQFNEVVSVFWLKPSSDRVYCHVKHTSKKAKWSVLCPKFINNILCCAREAPPSVRKFEIQTTISPVFPPFNKLWPWSNQSNFFWPKRQGNFKKIDFLISCPTLNSCWENGLQNGYYLCLGYLNLLFDKWPRHFSSPSCEKLTSDDSDYAPVSAECNKTLMALVIVFKLISVHHKSNSKTESRQNKTLMDLTLTENRLPMVHPGPKRLPIAVKLNIASATLHHM